MVSQLDQEEDMTAGKTTAGQLSAAESTTAEGTTAEGATEVPVACSLTAAGLAAQAGRWKQLAARAMAERAKTAHGLRIGFRPGPGVEQELRALAAVETECCAWATWTVTASAERIVLDVRSAGEGVAALHAMFTGLRPPAGPG
jgi:hypothetical protein